MSELNHGYTPQQEEVLFNAFKEFISCTDTDGVLHDLTRMYFMAQENYLLNDPHVRQSVSISYSNLHDLVSVVDMVARDQEHCHLIGV